MPATKRSLFLLKEYFTPTSSAPINAIANRKPPLPSFQERTKVSGYTIRVNKIGEISIKVAAMLDLMPNITWPSVPSEATVLSLDKFHIFVSDPRDKNVLELHNCFGKPAGH